MEKKCPTKITRRQAAAERFKKIRAMRKRKMSYAEIAEAVGVSRQRVFQVVNGNRDGNRPCPFCRKPMSRSLIEKLRIPE